MSLVLRMMAAFMAQPAEKGAEISIYLATSPDVVGTSDRYFDRQVAINSSPDSYNVDLSKRLWQVSEDLTKK